MCSDPGAWPLCVSVRPFLPVTFLLLWYCLCILAKKKKNPWGIDDPFLKLEHSWVPFLGSSAETI